MLYSKLFLNFSHKLTAEMRFNHHKQKGSFYMNDSVLSGKALAIIASLVGYATASCVGLILILFTVPAGNRILGMIAITLFPFAMLGANSIINGKPRLWREKNLIKGEFYAECQIEKVSSTTRRWFLEWFGGSLFSGMIIVLLIWLITIAINK